MLLISKSEAHGVLGPVGTGGFRPRPAIGGGAARRLTAAMQAMETVGPIGPIEVPTPAHAVRLRRPVCLTATYVVACTALLVSVSLLPFGSGATAPVANARGDRERAGPVVERARRASEDPSFDSEPRLAGETRTLSDEKRRSEISEDLGSPNAFDGVRSAADDSSSSSSTNADDSDPSCVFHVYRHLSKTGGTTVRFVFDRQTVFGDFEYPLEYGFDEGKWDALLTRWRAKADAFFANDGDASPPRTLVEIRGNWPSNWPAEVFATRILSDVERLRAEYGEYGGSNPAEKNVSNVSKTFQGNRSCSVTTSLMLRDPAEQYESFWRYYIEKRQQKAAAAGTDTAQKKWPDVDGAPFWGDSFAEWASRVPSMQIREVLGDKCVAQMRQPPFDAELATNGSWVRTGDHSFDRETCPYEVNEHDFARFESLLERVDVVGVTERFDAFLLRLGETVGLKRLEYVKSNVKASSASSRRPNASETEAQTEKNKTETERTRRVVADVARWDAKAHALARQRLDADVARDAAGGAAGFERRLAAFEARTVVMSDGKTFVGGVPPRSPYVWVKSGDVKASGGALSPVVPSSFTDETGGGQAVAYIVFDPVTLTARDDAERVGAACVKGCTFDAPTT